MKEGNYGQIYIINSKMIDDILNLDIFSGIEKDIVKKIIENSPEKNFKLGEIILLE